MDERLRRLYVEAMVNVDVLDFAAVEDIRALHTVFLLLRERVGSPISYQGLAEDVGISPKTAKRYVGILEDLYLVFLVRPYTNKIARAIRKEPKAYLYDLDLVIGDEGKRLENLVALSLLKEDFYLQDTRGEDRGLSYVRVKDGNEVDFVRTKNDKAVELIEVKHAAGSGTKQLSYFADRYHIPATQVVGHTTHEILDYGPMRIVRAKEYLEGLAI